MATDIIIPSVERIQKDIQHLKEWMSKEPHLPQINDENWLKTFLSYSKFSLEKTKSKLEGYYSMRSKYPEFLKNRDPTSPEILKSRDFVKIAMTGNEKYWVLFVQYEKETDGFDVIPYIKRLCMILDMMLLKSENRLTEAISVVNLRDLGYVHCLKITAEAPKFAELMTKGYPERTKAVHYVNFPAFVQKFFEVIQRLFPKKLIGRSYCHSAVKSSLLEMVDTELLCSDFGGSGPSLPELEEQTQQELEKYRKWFAEQETICSDESLRRRDFDQAEEMTGSFRKLEVD